MDIKIGSKGTEVVFPSGYMNRATRRRYAKIMKRGGTNQMLAKMHAHAK